jgi:RNA chaperone Hfq
VAVLAERITVDNEPVAKKTKSTTKPLINGFVPKLRGKKVTIRLVSGGQPITGILEGYNPYEILIQTAKGQFLVFKYAIATIEQVDGPKGFTIER